jgi:hypothetical protein
MDHAGLGVARFHEGLDKKPDGRAERRECEQLAEDDRRMIRIANHAVRALHECPAKAVTAILATDAHSADVGGFVRRAGKTSGSLLSTDRERARCFDPPFARFFMLRDGDGSFRPKFTGTSRG